MARAGGAGAATGYAYDGASRLYTLGQTLAGSASVTYTFGYNAAGQIPTKQVSNGAYVAHPASIASTYTTNGLNQYTGVTGSTATYTASNSAALTYDPTGALLTETASGVTTTFLYDGANLAGEYSSTGAILNRYAPGPGVDEPLVWYQGAGTSTREWLTADNQGSVIGYADQKANSGAIYTYGPYGEPITSTGASAWGGSRYRFTGQIEIPEAQLYYSHNPQRRRSGPSASARTLFGIDHFRLLAAWAKGGSNEYLADHGFTPPGYHAGGTRLSLGRGL